MYFENLAGTVFICIFFEMKKDIEIRFCLSLYFSQSEKFSSMD